MQDFSKLKVWQKAHTLTLRVYEKTSTLPRHEIFGLRAQMRRAAVSIPTNIAEGCGRGGRAQFGHFLKIAMGSSSELEYQLLLVYDLGWMKAEAYHALRDDVREIKRMLTGFLSRLVPETRSLSNVNAKTDN